MSKEQLAVKEAPARYSALVENAQGVPLGYKQTEVGVIPEDWELIFFGDVVDYTKGFAVKSAQYKPYGVRIIRVSDTTFDSIKDDGEIFLSSEEAHRFRKWELKEFDLIISTVGSKPPMYDSMVGKVTLMDVWHEGCLLNQNAVVLRARNKSSSTQILLHNIFKQSRYIDYIEKIFRGNANQASITLKELFEFPIALPKSGEEQRAIAAALSDVDALVAALDKLIAKKRAIKTAAMQQLLTGKQRLPGFSGEWEVKRLGEVLSVRHGKSQHQIVANDGKYPILATSGEIGRTNTFLYNKPSVLIGRKGTIDKPQYQESPFWTIDTLFYTEIASETSPKFIYYKFITIDWLSYNEASGVPSLNASTIEAIEFQCPDIEEQTAIATVLCDMDTEIAALEARRDKTKAIKQGMMQELLTGKTRLIENGQVKMDN